MPQAERVLLAAIGAPHGVKGEVRVKSFAAEPQALADYGPLLDDDGRSFEIERLRPGKTVLVVKFRGIDDRDAAAALNGTLLHIARDRLPAAEPDEFYHADLIGLAAETETGDPLGTVTAVLNFGAGDLLEIAPSRGAPLLVPFTKATVPRVDLDAKRIVVAPPPETEVEAEDQEQEQDSA
jgi:16S rRNA processing protein RimM